jgi:hypothetical protein
MRLKGGRETNNLSEGTEKVLDRAAHQSEGHGT